MHDRVSPECISWFQGTILEDYDRPFDVVQNMQTEYFTALNDATFGSPVKPTADAKVVAITADRETMTPELARPRLLALAAKRGLTPINGRIHSTARAYFLEAH
jgi:hypothetical protein